MGLHATVLICLTEIVLTVLVCLTKLVLSVLVFLTEIVLTVLAFLAEIVLTLLTFLTEIALTCSGTAEGFRRFPIADSPKGTTVVRAEFFDDEQRLL